MLPNGCAPATEYVYDRKNFKLCSSKFDVASININSPAGNIMKIYWKQDSQNELRKNKFSVFQQITKKGIPKDYQ